jgi:hypothetical protein
MPSRTKISIADKKVIHKMAEGLGFNWYAAFPENTYPSYSDEKRWKRIFEHADWLNINFIRFGQASGQLSDNNGNFKESHNSFQQLKMVNSWATKRDVSLVLDPFSVPKVFCYDVWDGAPLVWDKKGHYSPAVNDIDGYVSKFAVPYLKHVVNELGCKNVRWFNFINEPLAGGVFAAPPGTDDHVRYVEVLKALRQGMDEAGLQSIGLMGPDTNTLNYWPIPRMVKSGADPDSAIQAYCMHQYHSHFDWDSRSKNMTGALPMSVGINNQLAKYCQYAHVRNKPYLVTEVGMFHYGWANGDPAGIARHDNVLLELEFIIRGMREKADGFLRWAWLNPGNIDGWWQLINTTDGTDSPIQNPYYGYGTLYRYVDRQAEIIDTEIEYAAGQPVTVHAVAVQNGDGTRSLFVINDSYANPVDIVVEFEGKDGSTVRKIVTDHIRKHFESECIATLNGKTAEWHDVLFPMSITVYTTKQ